MPRNHAWAPKQWQLSMLKGEHRLTTTRPLQASLSDTGPEMNDGDDISFAPSTERDNYVTERDTAEQANLLAATTTATGSIELQQEISNSFLQYALSIILGRAIPDARDGLKPVHRRILYAMDQLSLVPTGTHRKCARVVGEVLGKFHPHGDMAVYDALVRLAQDFSTNHPLIDGHGNFGSIDADPAAAMRYTECKLTPLSQAALLQDLNEDTVEYIANFDGNEKEPTVLPARLPVLLINGASGIAVGMATNVPPHNLKEILAACSALVTARQKQQTVTDKKLLQLVPAPDFPTGAFILGTSGAEQLYSTGNGGIVMRATTEIENVVVGKKGQSRNAIIIKELPYQVNKAALLEKIAALVNDKKLDGIADLRDESDRDGIRVVIELKRDAVAAVVLNNLYKKTSLQSTFSGNFLALMSNGDGATSSLVPQRFTLRQALDCFLDFRFSTIRKKSKFQLSKVESRLHIVEGLLLALAKVDEVIKIVRSSPDPKVAKEKVKQMLGATEEQTESILRLQLGQLTRLNKGKLDEEKSDLLASQSELKNLLDVDNAVYDVMKGEFKELSTKFGVERKSRIMIEDDGELSEMDLIRNSRSVIVVLRSGYIKRMPLGTFESQGRGTKGKRGAFDGGTGEQGDEIAHCFTCNDHDTLLMVTQNGIAHGIRAYQIPIGSRTAKGQAIPSVLPLGAADTITAVLRISEFVEDVYLVLATEHGFIKRTPVSAFGNMTGRGLTIATLEEGDSLKWCQLCTDNGSILLGTKKGMATRFAASEIRPTGRTSRGVQAMKLREGDSIADMNVLGCEKNTKGPMSDARDFVLAVTAQGFGKRIPRSDFRIQHRGGKGVVAIKFKKNTTDQVCALAAARESDEILLITAKGIIVRQQVSQIPAQSRTATGVLVQRLDDGDYITTVSRVPEYEETDNDAT
ncbi:hypothetical protein MPSEU_000085600 [Mayamaea pseudoterrestris]|nr:hypothetical protein MPSEU_000085600 [Mayamaea pseudoterrestris]